MKLCRLEATTDAKPGAVNALAVGSGLASVCKQRPARACSRIVGGRMEGKARIALQHL